VLSSSKSNHIDGCIGGVSTISVPLIITSIIAEANPVSTLFASCSSSSSLFTSSSSSISSSTESSSQSPSQQSSVSSFNPVIIPTTILVTTTPSPTVITEEASSTLDNGVVTVITVTTTSTPPPTVVLLSTSIFVLQPTASHSQGSKSSSAIAPIVGGAAGGFSCLIIAVVAIWFILCVLVTLPQSEHLSRSLSRRKCRRSSEEEDDIVFPYPVTRDRGHAQHLDLSHEPKPYVYGLVGHSSHDGAVMAPRSSFSHSRASDGRPDSATALIGEPSGLTSMAMATGAGGLLSSAPSAQSKGEAGRQVSHSPISYLPPGAAAPSTYLDSSSGSGGPPPGSSRYPLQVVNPPSSIRSSFPAEMAEGSSAKAPLVVSEGGGQSARAEKKSAPPPSHEGGIVIHMDGGRLPVSDDGGMASGSGSKTLAQPEVSNSDAPPAYVA
jgi:hypothetical protein